ncbi:MAG: hypothetical protein ACLR0U_32275 [Enterocloster clostridioformis]
MEKRYASAGEVEGDALQALCTRKLTEEKNKRRYHLILILTGMKAGTVPHI